MSFEDKSLQCFDCSVAFTFDAQEQEQFAARGYTNAPKRCPSCRETRKAKQSTDGGNNHNSGNSYRDYSSTPRQMFPIKCATCGKDTQVPFEPHGDRPVYCPDCYRKTNPVRRN